tara:strand:+ start:463 stop:1689 length:1227 start_codon:yes stop_codon:yes gene_type:complete
MNFLPFVSVLLFPFVLLGLDWPTYGGLNRDHSSNETGLRLNWEEEEPEVLWSIKVGAGYSSVVVSGGFALCQGNENGKNTLYCLDTDSGKVQWTHQYPCKKSADYFQGGSRSTPTIAGEHVFLLSHEGDLYALEFKTGNVLWSTNLVKDLNGVRPQWGYSSAPLVAEDKVIVQTGSEEGSLVALDSLDGSVVWRTGNYGAGYSSPFLRKSSKREIVSFNQFGLVLNGLSDGEEFKKYQHTTRYGINATQPLEVGDSFLISSAYGKGTAFIEERKSSFGAKWESDAISCQMASLVKKDQYAFGIHGQAGARARHATLFCLEIESGKKIWEKKGFGVGSIILVQDTLVVLSDEGTLTLVATNPRFYQELANFQVLPGKNNWTPPTYSSGRMHCRSSGGTWVCLSMKKSIP